MERWSVTIGTMVVPRLIGKPFTIRGAVALDHESQSAENATVWFGKARNNLPSAGSSLNAKAHRHRDELAVVGTAFAVTNPFEHALGIDLVLVSDHQDFGLALNFVHGFECQLFSSPVATEQIAELAAAPHGRSPVAIVSQLTFGEAAKSPRRNR